MTFFIDSFRITAYAPDSQRTRHWIEDAICDQYGTPDDWDYAAETVSEDARRAARRVCGRCPVRGNCMFDAEQTNDIYTFRAGTSGPEREAMWRAEGKRCKRGHDGKWWRFYGGSRRCRACEQEAAQAKRKKSAA